MISHDIRVTRVVVIMLLSLTQYRAANDVRCNGWRSSGSATVLSSTVGDICSVVLMTAVPDGLVVMADATVTAAHTTAASATTVTVAGVFGGHRHRGPAAVAIAGLQLAVLMCVGMPCDDPNTRGCVILRRCDRESATVNHEW